MPPRPSSGSQPSAPFLTKRGRSGPQLLEPPAPKEPSPPDYALIDEPSALEVVLSLRIRPSVFRRLDAGFVSGTPEYSTALTARLQQGLLETLSAMQQDEDWPFLFRSVRLQDLNMSMVERFVNPQGMRMDRVSHVLLVKGLLLARKEAWLNASRKTMDIFVAASVTRSRLFHVLNNRREDTNYPFEKSAVEVRPC